MDFNGGLKTLKKISLIFLFLILNISLCYGRNVAFVIDSTKSLKNVLPAEKRSIKAVLELLAVLEKGSKVTVAKFGAENEGEVILSSDISLKKLPQIYKVIDKSLSLNNLYTRRTAFNKGLSLILDTHQKFDITFFITDGKDNYPQSLEEFQNKYKNYTYLLGKVIFLIVSKNDQELPLKYKIRLRKWQKILNAQIKFTSSQTFLKDILFLLIKEKGENNLIKNAYISLNRYFTLTKYSDNSVLYCIFIPSIKINSVKPKGNFYNGFTISFVEIDSKSGKYTIELNKSARRFVLIYENIPIFPYLTLTPKRAYYYKNESINYILYFKTSNNKKIEDPTFEKNLFVELKDKDKLLVYGRLDEIKTGHFFFPTTGEHVIKIKYSYFKESLPNAKEEVLKIINIKSGGDLFEVKIGRENIYEFSPFNILIKYKGIKPIPPIVNFLLYSSEKKQKKNITFILKNKNVYQSKSNLCLSCGSYQIISLEKKFLLSGRTSFKILPRFIEVKILKDNQCLINRKFNIHDKILEIPLKLDYFPKEKESVYSIEINLTPLFPNEIFSFYIKPIKEKNITFEGKYYLPFILVSFSKEGNLNIFCKKDDKQNNKIFLIIKKKNNLTIDKFLDNDIFIGNLKNISLFNSCGNFTFPNKKIILSLEIDPFSKAIFLAKQTFKFFVLIIIIFLIGLAIFVWIIWKIRISKIKQRMWREILNKSPEDFFDEFPSNIKKILGDKNAFKFWDKRKLLLLYKDWDFKKLKEIYKKINTPIQQSNIVMDLSQLPITITSFKSGDDVIRLRDKDFTGEIEIDREKKKEALKISSTYFLEINDKNYLAGIPITIESKKISIKVKNYNIFVEVDFEINKIYLTIIRN